MRRLNWMKRIYAFLLILCLLMFFCACDSADVSIGDSAHEETSSNYIVDSSDEFQNHDKVYHKEYGKLTSNSDRDEVLVYSKSSDSEYQTEVFLGAHVGDNKYAYSLGEWDASVFEHGSIIVTDLNDDEVDEIVLYMEVTKNGGTLTQVFSVKDNAINLICDLNELDLEIDTIYENDYSMKLENEDVGFSCRLDISNQFSPDQFDAEGKALVGTKILLLPINSCKIVSDGESQEIHCTRLFRLTDYLGAINIVYIYDDESASLEVKNLNYVEYVH